MLKLSVGAIILGLFFYKVGIREMLSVLSNTKAHLLLLSVAVYAASLVIGSSTLYLLMKPLGRALGFKDYLGCFLLSWTTVHFTPGRVGELTILYFMRDYGIGLGKGAAAIVTDKLISFINGGIVAVIGLAYFFGARTALFGLGTVFVIGSGALIMLSGRLRLFVRKYILRKYSSRLSGFSRTFFYYFRENRGLLVANLLLTFTRLLLISLSAAIMFRALGAHVRIVHIIMIAAITGFLLFVPFTFNGMGVIQVSGTMLYMLAGVPADIAAARYLLEIVSVYAVAMVILAFVKGPSQLRRRPGPGLQDAGRQS